jgi:hypothetical protein
MAKHMKAGKEGMMNRAEEEEPHTVRDRTPARAPKHAAGEETKYSNRAWTSEREKISGMGSAHVGADLGKAVDELHEQHPIKHHQHGPHHGKTHHIRHEPMHGLHPKRSHAR